MAKYTNSATTVMVPGNREQMADVITNIAPWDSPLFSMGKKTSKYKGRQFDWNVQDLPSPDYTTQAEGFVFVPQAAILPSRLHNVHQINTKNAVVSKTQQLVDSAGMGAGGLMANQIAIKSKALKRDIEWMLTGTNPIVVGDDGTGTGRQSRGFEHFLTTNVSAGTGYVAPANETTALVDGSLRHFSKTILDSILNTAWQSGADIDNVQMVVNGFMAGQVSSLATRNGVQTQVKEKNVLLGGGITVYASDFGDTAVVKDRYIRPRTILGVDPDYYMVSILRPFEIVTEPVPGDNIVKSITTEWGLQVTSERAHFKICDLAYDATSYAASS